MKSQSHTITPLIGFVLLTIAVSLIVLSQPIARAQSDAEAAAALDIVARINAYRDQLGLHPLQVNARLEAMARAQAEYLASLDELPENGDFHTGPNGLSPRERALRDPVNWETYGSDVQIAIGENAAVGSVSFSMDYWLGSTIHHNTIVNPAYREIGVAAVSHPFGYIFIVVFGGRPNEIPVLVNPYTQRLYIANDYFTGGTGDWLGQAQQMQVFDAEGEPLTEVIPWRNTLPIPATDGDTLSVVFDDGTHQVATEVDLQRDIVVLPDTLALVQNLPAGEEAAPTLPPVAAATPAPTPEAAPTVEAAPPANQVVADPDIRVIYDNRTLTLLNLRDYRIDISQLSLVGGGGVLPLTTWAKVAPASLDAFFPRGCLQVWGWNEPTDLPEPRVCGVRVAYITIAEAARFWIGNDFVVMQGDTPIATCAVGAGVCDAALLN
jgi:uncharacterized protein YkwD